MTKSNQPSNWDVSKVTSYPEEWEVPTTDQDPSQWDTSKSLDLTELVPIPKSTIYSGEPLDLEQEYPVEYIHVSGAKSICHNPEELSAAMRYDTKLVVWPVIVMIAVITAIFWATDFPW